MGAHDGTDPQKAVDCALGKGELIGAEITAPETDNKNTNSLSLWESCCPRAPPFLASQASPVSWPVASILQPHKTDSSGSIPVLRKRNGRCRPGRWPPAVRQLETRARTAAEAFWPELRPSASPPAAICDRGEPRGLPQLSERSCAPARGRGSFHGALATTLWASGTLPPLTANEMLRVYSNSTVESPPRAAQAQNGLLRKRVRKGFHITGPKT